LNERQDHQKLIRAVQKLFPNVQEITVTRRGRDLPEITVKLVHGRILVIDESALAFAERVACLSRARRAKAVIDAWSAFLPARIVKEDVGDYMEDIGRRAADGQYVLLACRVIAAICWTMVNSIGYFMKQVRRGRKA